MKYFIMYLMNNYEHDIIECFSEYEWQWKIRDFKQSQIEILAAWRETHQKEQGE